MEKYLHLKCMGMITPVFCSIFAPAQIVFAAWIDFIAVIVFVTASWIDFIAVIVFVTPKNQ